MTIQTISTLPDAPTPADSPTEFATKAAAFVPALNPFGVELNQFGVDVVADANSVIESAQDTINITAQGLFDAIVVGDTDGVNKEFNILNASFYPYFMIFQDGVKIPNDEITMSGTTATLVTAPNSGAKMEAIAPRSIDFIAPEGFKTIALCSDKNGTIELECIVSGSVLPQWKVGGVTTESESFSYSNSGDYVYIYLYVPDNSESIIDMEAQDIYLIDIQNQMDSVSRIKMRDNADVSYYNSLSNLTNIQTFIDAWINCSSLTSFPLIDASDVTNFSGAWYNCSGLTSFPLINSSSVTTFSNSWRNCSGLTSFPLIDSSNVTTFSSAWYGCSGLTSFPLIDSSNVISFNQSWRDCSSLTSFPSIDSSSVANFDNAWRNCSSLASFPALDYTSGDSFVGTWYGCALTETYVNQILSNLDSDDVSNCIIGLNGGTNASPTGAGLTAKANLEIRGCTVYVNQ